MLITWLNTRGIQSSARINSGLAIVSGLVIAIFFVAAARIIFGHPHEDPAFFTRPFYDPETWNTKAVLGGTSIAVLTYIGFDGISTLSEEAENPRRNILFATVLTCLVIGILSAFEVYAAQLVWPASTPFPDVDTAFVHVAGHAWAPLFAIVGFTLVVANFGSGLGSQLGSRPAPALWHGAQQRFAEVVLRRLATRRPRVPQNSVLFVGAVALIGAFCIDFGLGAEMLNFGALIAFMGVNAAALLRYYVRASEKRLTNLVPPLIGFSICLLLWLNLSLPAKIAGGIWMAVGIAFGAWKTRGFRGELVDFELPPEEA